MENYTVKFDGSCWPNPGGVAAYGFILYLDGAEVECGNGVIGEGNQYSNNYAEHWALYQGLLAFTRHANGKAGKTLTLHIQGDSLMIINHASQKHKGHADKLYYPAYKEVMKTLDVIRKEGVKVTTKWVSRNQNQECDDLSKLHLTK